MHTGRVVTAIALIAVAAGGVQADGKVYRWVDEAGKVHFGDRAPAAGATEVKIESFRGDAEVLDGDAAGNEVVLYTTRWCPSCRRAREHLSKRGIPFSDWDIESNPYARAEYNILKGRGVPLILVGKQRMNGFNGAKLDKMLVKASYVLPDRERKR